MKADCRGIGAIGCKYQPTDQQVIWRGSGLERTTAPSLNNGSRGVLLTSAPRPFPPFAATYVTSHTFQSAPKLCFCAQNGHPFGEWQCCVCTSGPARRRAGRVAVLVCDLADRTVCANPLPLMPSSHHIPATARASARAGGRNGR